MTLLDPSWEPALSIGGRIGQIFPESVRPVASYNWMRTEGRDEPTIVVPGCPRLWTSKQYPFSVPRDTGREYKDADTEQFAGKTWHPLFLSVRLMEPEFNFDSLDVIADKSVLRNLFRLISNERRRDFAIEAQLFGVNNTLLLTSPNPDRKYMSRLFRHSTQKFHTYVPAEWEKAEDHYRIITYTFGGLNLMVRFPVDICYPPEGFKIPSLTAVNSEGRSSHGLNYIHHEGNVVYQNSTAEIMVRSQSNRELKWEDIWHQLYFSWSGRLFVVHHLDDRVTGSVPHFLTRSQKIQSSIANAAEDLKRLEDLLDQIRQYIITIQNGNPTGSTKLGFRLDQNQSGIEVTLLPSNSLSLPLDQI